jgi:hypothetical protein
MKATRLIAAVAFAAASTGVFAETGVKFSQVDNVTNIYGRAAVATVKVKGDVQTAGAEVNSSGRTITAMQGATIATGDAIGGGRS